MTSLHWKIMCSAPLQKMAVFYLGGWGEEAEKNVSGLENFQANNLLA